MKIKHLVAITLGLLLGASCSNELPAGQDDNSLFGEVPEGMFEYRFTLQGITPTRLSYADVPMEANEMKINNAKVLVFGQAAAGALSATDKLVCVKDAKIMNNKINFLIDKNTNFYGAVKVSIVQICNYDNSNISSMTLIPGTTTYGDVFNNLESQGDAGAEIEVRGLLQIGKSIDNSVPTGSAKLILGNITIRRPFARFDVKNAGMKALTITALKVKNISNKFYVLSEKFPADAIFTHQKELSVPAGLKLPTDGSKPDPKFVPGVLYSYPGSTAGDDSPVLLVTGKLVTGAGKEEILTDKEVPFAKGDNKLKIATNKRYTLTLKAELDGIVVDIAESFAEWGSVDDASLTYESNLDNDAAVARVGEGLQFGSVAADGTLNFKGTKGQANYNFSVENVPAGTTVTAMVGSEAQVVKSVETYGELTNYVVELTDAVKTNEAEQTINIVGTKDGKTVFSIAIKHEGSAVVVPEVVEYPVSEGKTLPAIKVGDIWWAPINVGATNIDEPGLVYQYGRNCSWSLSDAYAQCIESPFDLEKLAEIQEKPYVGSTTMPNPISWCIMTGKSKDTFDKGFAPNWATVSDGTKNPCPAGWRIPTKAEFEALLTPEVISKSTFTSNSATLKFPDETEYKLRFVGYLDPNQPFNTGNIKSEGLFWTVYNGTIDTEAYIFTSTGVEKKYRLSLATCCNLRCVKDAAK